MQSCESDWIVAWLSGPRWNRYLGLCAGDRDRALELSEASLRVGQAIMHDIAHVEVALRNAFDAVLSDAVDADDHWLFAGESPVLRPLLRRRRGRTFDVNARNRDSVRDAMRRAHSSDPAPGQVIAELPFGFWRHMTDAAHEKSLWVPHLHRAFSRGSDRRAVGELLSIINAVRNRASHHEQLATRRRRGEVRRAAAAVTAVERLMSPDLEAHTRATSTVAEALDHLESIVVE